MVEEPIQGGGGFRFIGVLLSQKITPLPVVGDVCRRPQMLVYLILVSSLGVDLIFELVLGSPACLHLIPI